MRRPGEPWLGMTSVEWFLVAAIALVIARIAITGWGT